MYIILWNCKGYGQTEDVAGVLLTRTLDPVTQHLGGPGFSFEIKLVDVRDLGYTSENIDREYRKKDLLEKYVLEVLLYLKDILKMKKKVKML